MKALILLALLVSPSAFAKEFSSTDQIALFVFAAQSESMQTKLALNNLHESNIDLVEPTLKVVARGDNEAVVTFTLRDKIDGRICAVKSFLQINEQAKEKVLVLRTSLSCK